MNVQVCARFVIICLTNGNHFECDTGDFHFAWECLRVTFHALWGSERDKGSLANLKDVASRKHADRGVKVFSIGDELLQHAFEAHLLAAITTTLSMSSPEVSLPEQSEKSLSWLDPNNSYIYCIENSCGQRPTSGFKKSRPPLPYASPSTPLWLSVHTAERGHQK